MSLLQSILNIPVVSRTRRNHALEHATITILSRRLKHASLAGRSTHKGFHLLGQVETEDVRQAVEEALTRMRGGEPELAIHPNCGTNLVTSALLSGLSASLVTAVAQRRSRETFLERVPALFLSTIAALIVAQPLGLLAQQHLTTLGVPGDIRVTRITRSERGRLVVHFVETEG